MNYFSGGCHGRKRETVSKKMNSKPWKGIIKLFKKGEGKLVFSSFPFLAHAPEFPLATRNVSQRSPNINTALPFCFDEQRFFSFFSFFSFF
jgi:hypothetical protein